MNTKQELGFNDDLQRDLIAMQIIIKEGIESETLEGKKEQFHKADQLLEKMYHEMVNDRKLERPYRSVSDMED